MGEFRKLKQPLSFEEQLEHLIQDKNLKVLNKRNALDVLKRENYYRLAAIGSIMLMKMIAFFHI